MYIPLLVAFSFIALFAFPAVVLGASKVLKRRFNSGRPEPSRPNTVNRNIPGGDSNQSD